MRFFRQLRSVLRSEAQFFSRYPKQLLASLLVMAIPALYVLIYLSSVWEPEARTGRLPVGLVNLDQGFEYNGQLFNAGWEVAASLRSKHTFGFVEMAQAQEARRGVRDGRLAFALIIPPDFSAHAIPGQDAGAGKLVVYLSEGNNFESALIARNFARELGHDVNESLNERRWRLVLQSAAGSQHSVDRLRDGVQQLRSGAHTLSKALDTLEQGATQTAHGSDRVADGLDKLTGGVRQLGSGLRSMDAKRPGNSDLDRLKDGASSLAAGHAELSRGMAQIRDGSRRVREGTAAFRDDARSSLLVPSRVGDGLDQLHDGLVQLETGIQTAADAQRELSDGSMRLSTGVDALTSGVRGMGNALHSVVQRLPDDSQIDALESGADALASGNNALAQGSVKAHAGAQRLAEGLDLLSNALPQGTLAPQGSAQGLAESVEPTLEVVARVVNSGNAFAPNIIPIALWLGAGVAAFLVHVRVLPRHTQHYARTAQFFGKATIPALLVLAQTLLVFLTVYFGLGLHIADPQAFACVLGVSALTFLGIVLALTRALGDAGKALSMLLLAVQLSASGGILPVELSSGPFGSISPWLPLTWVVRAMKASMFGAYDADWGMPLAIVATVGLLALCSGCWIGRWRYVSATAARPALDF